MIKLFFETNISFVKTENFLESKSNAIYRKKYKNNTNTIKTHRIIDRIYEGYLTFVLAICQNSYIRSNKQNACC